MPRNFKIAARAVISINFLMGLIALTFFDLNTIIELKYFGQNENDISAVAWIMFLSLPVGSVIVMLIFRSVHFFEGRKENLAKSKPYIGAEVISIHSIILYMQILLIGAAFGLWILKASYIVFAMGIAMIFGGNYMPKSRSNTSTGIQTRWTMKSENVWIKTHRLAGRLFILCGVLMMISAYILSGKQLAYSLFGFAFAPYLIAVVMSFFYRRQELAADANDPVGMR